MQYNLGYEGAGYKRECLREKLLQCTEAQINLFNRMYVSIDSIPEEKMDQAYQQVMTTLEK